MKILYFLTTIFILIFGSIFGLIYTDFGNELIKKQINSSCDIKISKLSLKNNKLIIDASKNGVFIKILGTHNLLSANANVKMTFKNMNLLDAKIKGKIYDLNLDGYSKIFNSKIRGKIYFFKLKDLSVEKLDILGILKLLNEPKFMLGSANINLKNNKLNMNSNILLDKKYINLDNNLSLDMNLSMDNFKDATLSINSNLIKFSDHIKIDGVNLKTKGSGEISNIGLKKYFNKSYDKNITFLLGLNLTNNMLLNGYLDSEILNLKDIKAEILDKNIKASAILDIKNLNDLKFLTNLYFNAPLKADISTNFKNTNLSSNLFGGKLNLDIKNNNFIDLNFTNFNTSDFTKALGLIKFYDARSSLNLKYDLKNRVGEFVSKIKNAKLIKNSLIAFASNLIDLNLDEQLNGEMIGKIDKNIITFSLNLSAKNIYLKIDNAKFNTSTNEIDLIANFKNKDKSIDVKVSGDINRPNISSPNLIDNILDNKNIKKIKNKINKFFNSIF